MVLIASAAELWYADAQRGVGRAAIQQARRIAGTRGAQYLQLFTLPVNTPAIRFYERVASRGHPRGSGRCSADTAGIRL